MFVILTCFYLNKEYFLLTNLLNFIFILVFISAYISHLKATELNCLFLLLEGELPSVCGLWNYSKIRLLIPQVFPHLLPRIMTLQSPFFNLLCRYSMLLKDIVSMASWVWNMALNLPSYLCQLSLFSAYYSWHFILLSFKCPPPPFSQNPAPDFKSISFATVSFSNV